MIKSYLVPLSSGGSKEVVVDEVADTIDIVIKDSSGTVTWEYHGSHTEAYRLATEIQNLNTVWAYASY